MDSLSTHRLQTAAAVSGISLAPEDEHLATCTHLTRQQILRRRSHNMMELTKCYKDHYWGLMEEIRVRYREYMWKYGLTPFINNNNNNDGNGNGECLDNDGNECGDGSGNGNGKGGMCVFNGCDKKAMTLTRFCSQHILSDSKQQLYKPCEFSLRSAHAGVIPCGKPVLRSIVPSLCSMHFLKAQHHVLHALRKSGLNINSTNKLAPKLHVIVTEYVREIKKRRKNALTKNQLKIAPKLEIKN